ncbi:uncharacterized protein [Alexandromys fortis]|uniref:uncharacterized protein n=1 Tax=Alexandromys fortis TaxID=100897 RepID=UPI0021539606|nr:uncharacterized protein LOC126495983 [Microtus fortis]
MKKTDEPGKFTSFDDKRFIYITALPVKDHYVMYCEGHFPGKLLGMGKLIGRNPEENPEAMEEFKKFVLREGLKEENIIVRELNGGNRTVHASLCVPGVTATRVWPQTMSVSVLLCPLCAGSYCPFRVVCCLSLFPVSLWHLQHFLRVMRNSVSQCHNLSSVPWCPHAPPSLLCSVRSLHCSLCFPGFCTVPSRSCHLSQGCQALPQVLPGGGSEPQM